MRPNRKLAGLAAAVAALALAVPALAAGPDQKVEVKSTISVNPYANAGKVTAANSNCVEGRQVVIKEKGFGKIGSATTNEKGSWQAEPDYKGEVPFKVYAEVKASTQATAGPIYKCRAAVSKVRTISGG